MQDPDHHNPLDDQWIRSQLDGQLSATEAEAFNDRLRSDATFRRRFVQLADLETTMLQLCGNSKTEHSVSKAAGRSSPKLWSWNSIVMITAGVLLLLASTVLLSLQKQLQIAQMGSTQPTRQNAVEPASDATGTLTPQAVDHVAAVVVATSGDCDSDLKAGHRVMPGPLKLNQGQILMEFMSGAKVAVSGPASLNIESQLQATVQYGQVSTYVPERARGFVLNGPRAAIVDLGTEFNMNVTSDGVTDVSVTDGEVELSLLGEDGNTLVSQRLAESKTVRLNSPPGSMESLAFDNSQAFSDLHKLPEIGLHVSEDYVRHVASLAPEIYWRFEDSSEEQVQDHSANGMQAILVNPPEDTAATIQNGSLRLRHSSRSRYARTLQPIEDFGHGPLTFEFWMRPDHLGHATCLAVYADEGKPGEHHLSVIEIVTNTFLIHEPGAVRFLMRSPPSRHSEFGVNAFSPSVCTPGQWQHVVAVWNMDSIQLYFNGLMVRHVSVGQPDCPGKFHVILGQLDPVRVERQFSGALDEVAVYRRALSLSEVQLHYQMMTTANPQLFEPAAIAGTGHQ